MHRLRKLLGRSDVLVLADGRLSLDADLAWVDVGAFERLCDQIDRHRLADDPASPACRLLDLYRGPLLPGEDAPWAQGARERLRGRFARAIQALATQLQRQGGWDEAAALYERCVDLDPLAESFHRGLMYSLAEQGRVAEALDAYERCRDLLRAGLGAEPSAAVQRLRDTLEPR